jgi:hypothetical protein
MIGHMRRHCEKLRFLAFEDRSDEAIHLSLALDCFAIGPSPVRWASARNDD